MWAYQFAKLQHAAEAHGWTKFVSMQNHYSLCYREEEREMIPYCKETGVGLIPWAPLYRGLLARPLGSGSTAREESMKGMPQYTGLDEADTEIIKRVQELAEKDEATIFATDSILSMLMCAPRSVYPWDIVIVRQGNKVFLDKRDNATLDMVTVNENAADAPMDASEGSKDAINQPSALAEEATYINHNFANQVMVENENQKVEMAHENPFYNPAEETEPPASKAYKYRRFDLSLNDEDPVHLVVRTEIDAVQKNAISGEDQFITVKALNEFDHKAQGSGGALDWRVKLVGQRGAVVATEMKNNSCKLARWTVQSIMAKADVMKLGYVFCTSFPFPSRH